MKKLFSLILVVAMLLCSFAMAETVDSSTLSGDEKAAALGIPAAVVLQDTDIRTNVRIYMMRNMDFIPIIVANLS